MRSSKKCRFVSAQGDACLPCAFLQVTGSCPSSRRKEDELESENHRRESCHDSVVLELDHRYLHAGWSGFVIR